MPNKVLAVVEEELFPDLDAAVGVDSNPVVSVDEQDLDLTVGLRGVIGKPDMTSHPRRVDYVLLVEVEHVGALGFVVNSTPLSLSSWVIISPRYSAMNSFFSAGVPRKQPRPAISL